MEYISLRWYDIYQDFLDREVAANKEVTEPRVPFGKVEVITSKCCSRHPWLTVMEYLCHKWPPICSTCRKHFLRSFSHSRLITGFVTRLTRRVPLVEQELLTLPGHLSSPPVFSGIRVTRSLVLYVCFVVRCLSFCTFSFGHCVVCSSSIYAFWLPLWYLQTLLTHY